MGKIRIGIIRGGPSSEYDISLLTGESVLKSLPLNKYRPYDILVSKDGIWHENGFPSTPQKILAKLDVAFNAMHGEFGEDGKVQQIFEIHNVPYTGSGIIPSAMAMNKTISKDIFKNAGLNISRSISLKKDRALPELAEQIRENLFSPWVIKPASRGSSLGVSITKNIPELIGALNEAFMYDSEVIAEEFIKGREATCGVLEDFRNEKIYALPVIEIIPPKEEAFDYKNKYNGRTREICPANFDLETSREIQRMAILAHKSLGLSHYSRSDFIVSEDETRPGIFILEANTLPGFTSQSLFPKASEAVGLSFSNLLDHLASLALKRA